MSDPTITLHLASPDETAEVAEELAQQLRPGDVILLSGPVGAGKSHFSRHLIKSILVEPEDIPSPTFTLVQTYETHNGELWHSDLYRIGSTTEIEELGLAEAFEGAICIVEWPDRLGPLTPRNALAIELSEGANEDSRELTARWDDEKWTARTNSWASA